MMKHYLTIFLISFLAWSCAFDDSDIWDSIDDLDSRVKTLEEKLNAMNGEITTIKTLVSTLDSGVFITETKEQPDGSGYTIYFSDGHTIVIEHGTKGSDGNDGASAPVIGVGQEDGIYYWTLTLEEETEWLLDGEGERMPVTGAASPTPVMGVDSEGYWTVDYGSGPLRLTGNDGQPVKAVADEMEQLISGVDAQEDFVEFVLADGTTITIPIRKTVQIVIEHERTECFDYGQTRTFPMSAEGDVQFAVSKPDGWKVSVTSNSVVVTAPREENTFAEFEGTVSIVGIADAMAYMASFDVRTWERVTVTFEDADASLLAGPTAQGENLYSSYPDQYYGYHDSATDLMFMLNEFYDEYEFWYGGIALSQWNEMSTAGWSNQCSVYYSDPVTGMGGNNGSATFAVTYGYSGFTYPATVFFLDDDEEQIFESIWVNNSTWAAVVMQDGDGTAKQFTYEDQDYFKLTIKGIAADGTVKGTQEFYLADFRSPQSPGIVTDWTKVELGSLGKVHSLSFDLESSDVGVYGMNTPAYFCFDDLTIKR